MTLGGRYEISRITQDEDTKGAWKLVGGLYTHEGNSDKQRRAETR